jgi:hypothetical protein
VGKENCFRSSLSKTSSNNDFKENPSIIFATCAVREMGCRSSSMEFGEIFSG